MIGEHFTYKFLSNVKYIPVIVLEVTGETEKSILYKVVKNGNVGFKSHMAKTTFKRDYIKCNIEDY